MKNIILIFLLFDFSKEKELDFVKGTYNSPGIHDSVQMAKETIKYYNIKNKIECIDVLLVFDNLLHHNKRICLHRNNFFKEKDYNKYSRSIEMKIDEEEFKLILDSLKKFPEKEFEHQFIAIRYKK